MELALDGGRPPPTLLPPCDGRDISVELLGCCDDGGEVCGGRPYGPAAANDGSVGVPPIEPPGPPYRETKEESLLPVDSGEMGPPGPGLFITTPIATPKRAACDREAAWSGRVSGEEQIWYRGGHARARRRPDVSCPTTNNGGLARSCVS